MRNGKEIVPDEHITISFDGCVHKLCIPKSVVEDSAEFTATIDEDKTSAKLVVDGKWMAQFLKTFYSLHYSIQEVKGIRQGHLNLPQVDRLLVKTTKKEC